MIILSEHSIQAGLVKCTVMFEQGAIAGKIQDVYLTPRDYQRLKLKEILTNRITLN